jgi:two-component system response regulator RegA
MEKRGYDVTTAQFVHEARAVWASATPRFIVLDLRLGRASELERLPFFRSQSSEPRVILLPAYANVASAVMSIKIGPADCLAKSADVDMIDAALNAPETPRLPAPPDQLTSVNRANWEYINRIYEQSDRNVSQTARRLRMYRRTLQRRLRKRAPPG